MTRPRLVRRRTPWFWVITLMTLVLGVCGALVAYDLQLPALAIYAPAYWFLCAVYPEAALFFMFGSALFPYDLSGGLPVKLALGEIDLVLAAPFILLRAKHLRFSPLLISILLYFLVCVVSIVWNQIDKDTVISMTQMAIYLVLATILLANYAWNPAELLPGFYGIIAAGLILGLIGITTRESSIAGMNKNAAGAGLSFAAIVCTQLWFASSGKRRRRFAVALGIIGGGLLFSLSRGSWAGALAGILFVIAYHGRVKLVFQTLLVMVPVLLLCWWLMPEESRNYALDFSSESHNIQARYISIDTARSYFQRNILLGSGVGLRKQYDATNVLWSTLAETGILGLVTFLLIQVQFFATIWRRRKVFHPQSPAFSILAIAGGLVVCQFVHGCVDHYWARTLLTIWGSAAMAQGICMRIVKRRRPAQSVAGTGQPAPLRSPQFE